MIRNEMQRINKRRVDVDDYVYKVNIETWEGIDGDIECLGNAFFYTLEDADKFANNHCNDDRVMACDIYRADGREVVDYCKTWDDITMQNLWDILNSVYSDAYFEKEQ